MLQTKVQYTVVKHIGSGGFGRVYEAKGLDDELVALKKSHITKHIVNPMLRHEACALSLLAGHPSFPDVHAWGCSQYFEYLAMDILGRPMTSLLAEHGRLNLRSTLLLTDQLLDAIEHMHCRHIIHRDIKPGNFLFGVGNHSGRIHLIDYGLSRYYRDPDSLVHHPLEADQTFVGTVDYSSPNAHTGLALSRRDDLISLAYTIVSLLRGPLPWESISGGTVKHREARVCEKKRTWTGARLCAGFPQEFGDFVDYVQGLDYDQEPDYTLWRKTFRNLYRSRRFPEPDNFVWASAGAEESLELNNKGSGPVANTSWREPQIAKGDYILAQLLPSLSFEGRDHSSIDSSRWHDPTFKSPEWTFPPRPALVLDVTSDPITLGTPLHIATLLPLLYKAEELTSEETLRFVRLGNVRHDDERVIIPSPVWGMDRFYHAAPPRAFKVHLLPEQEPVPIHWRLNVEQLNLIHTWISDPYPSDIGSDAQAVIKDIEAVNRRYAFLAFAKIHPFLASHPSAASVDESSKDANHISWSGSRRFFEEIVRIHRRKAMDDGWPWSDEEGEAVYGQEDEDENSSDDGFVPLTSWPAPQGVTSKEVFGDEEYILKNRVSMMTELPIMEDEIYNDDEKLVV